MNSFEAELNLLNALMGKQGIYFEFKRLASEYPKVVALIPLLLACRDMQVEKFADPGGLVFPKVDLSDGKLTAQQLDEICVFASKSGLFDLFANTKIRSLPDYVMGVEVGLDKRGRENEVARQWRKLSKSY